MPERDTYKDRALEVRRDAQARLRELRQARMSRRAPTEDKTSFRKLRGRASGEAQAQPEPAGPVPGTVGTPSAGAVRSEDAATSMPAPAPAQEPSSEHAQPPPVPEPADAAPAPVTGMNGATSPETVDTVPQANPEPEVRAAEPPQPDPAPEPAAATPTAPSPPTDAAVEVRAAGAVDTETTPAATDPEPQLEPDPEIDEALKASDLNRLPGAGIGLVWLLRKCGVNDMAALARSDPDELAEKLGNVGQLISLQKWIEHAKAETGRRRRR